MTDPFASRVGGILSADIAVPEHERESRFYSRVLCTGQDPLWREDLMNNRGTPVIGLGTQSAEYANLPLQWMPHIQVASVAQSVAQAIKLGGKEVLHGKDGDGNSLWAVILDPNGAAFGLVPVMPQDQSPPTDDSASGEHASVGCIAWLDLTVANASATCEFYKAVVGWSAEDVSMSDADGGYSDYNMLAGDEHPAAGICHARGVNIDVPPIWMLYLPVADLAESLRRVADNGGKIVSETTGDDGKCTIAVVQDPVGVYVALAQD